MPAYRNFKHYIDEGWSREPKESFKSVGEVLNQRFGDGNFDYLDVGCATGELINFVCQEYPNVRATGCDVFGTLLDRARNLLPIPKFIEASGTNLPDSLSDAFDVVTAVGVISIFGPDDLKCFWQNLTKVCRTSGIIIVLGPLNDFGVDTVIRHRKRMDGQLGEWESGWNVFAKETVTEIVEDLGWKIEIRRFSPRLELEPVADPVRTWTLPTAKNPWQLTNGLQLLVNHYLMIATYERVANQEPA